MMSWGVKLFSISGAWIVGSSFLIIGKNSFYDKNKIVLGNYHGYMSPEVALNLGNENNISFDYFENDHSVEDKFNRGIYDMAIVSTSVLIDLKDKGLISEIEWNNLNLKKVSTDTNNISDATDAKELFSESVKKIVGNDLLKYGIPYFLNKLSFCYSGTKIDSLKEKITWKTLIEKISSEDIFKSKDGLPNLALIDDPRTVLSLARLVDDKSGINPESNDYSGGSSSILDSYLKIKNSGLNSSKLGGNFLLMDSNSSNLIDSLASKSIKGAFMYNGDCLYASQGGNFGNSKKFKKDEFHIVEIDKDIYFLDFLVFSKKLNSTKKNNSYEMAKKLLFYKEEDNVDYLKKEDEEYSHIPTKNFDYVQYTPVLKKPLEKIISSYFESSDDLKEEKEKMLKIEINSDISNVENFYEKKISEKMKSDMFSAFEKFKLSL